MGIIRFNQRKLFQDLNMEVLYCTILQNHILGANPLTQAYIWYAPPIYIPEMAFEWDVYQIYWDFNGNLRIPFNSQLWKTVHSIIQLADLRITNIFFSRIYKNFPYFQRYSNGKSMVNHVFCVPLVFSKLLNYQRNQPKPCGLPGRGDPLLVSSRPTEPWWR